MRSRLTSYLVGFILLLSFFMLYYFYVYKILEQFHIEQLCWGFEYLCITSHSTKGFCSESTHNSKYKIVCHDIKHVNNYNLQLFLENVSIHYMCKELQATQNMILLFSYLVSSAAFINLLQVSIVQHNRSSDNSGFGSAGMRHCVIFWVVPEVSKECCVVTFSGPAVQEEYSNK